MLKRQKPRSNAPPAGRSDDPPPLVEQPLETVEEMYAQEGTSDLTKLERGSSRRTRNLILIVIGILALLFGAAVGGFLLFTKEKGKFGQRIRLSVTGPSMVASGETVTYRIAYANDERLKLNNAELTLQYPEGFRFASAVPKPSNEFNNAWSLGNLAPRSGGEIVVAGQLIGDLNETVNLRATLNYRPENFNYDFQETAAASTTISSSNVKLTLSLPLRVISKKEFSWEIHYQNTSPQDVDRVRIVAEYPEAFTFLSAEPQPVERDRIWEFDRLSAGAEGKITIHGSLAGDPGEAREFVAKVGAVENGTFRLTGESTSILFLIRAGLGLSLTVNGSLGEHAVSWNDRLVVHLVYKNDGDSEIADANLSVTMVGRDKAGNERALLDWSTLTDAAKGRREGNSITWDRRAIPALARLKPGDDGELTFSVKLVQSPAVKAESDLNFSVATTARSTVPKIPEIDAENFTSESSPVTSKISSKVALTAEGRYYSELYEPLGTGPLPPEAGKTTAYRIFWDVTNTTNDLTDLSVKSVLPENVLWTGRSTVTGGEPLRFDPKTREVTWTVSRVPAGTGQILPTLEANFEVSVTPRPEDEGTLLVLTRKTELRATDSFTLATLTAEQGLVTSELTNDINAKGKGIVVQ